MNWLIQLIDSNARHATARAREWFASAHPEFEVSSASLVAVEPERFVFAVFYSVPQRPSRPDQYRLVTVERKSSEVAEFFPPRESSYWLRGRK